LLHANQAELTNDSNQAIPRRMARTNPTKRQKASAEEALDKALAEIGEAVRAVDHDVERVLEVTGEEHRVDASHMKEIADSVAKEEELKSLVNGALANVDKDKHSVLELQKTTNETILNDHREALRALLST
jgi:hypothetical protein